MEEHIEIGAMGQVRPTNGLGHTPDWVDCPTCRKRRMTVVTRIPSERTKYVSHLSLHCWKKVLIDTLFSPQNRENCLRCSLDTVLLRVLWASGLVQVVL